jgi:hypothetical protein
VFCLAKKIISRTFRISGTLTVLKIELNLVFFLRTGFFCTVGKGGSSVNRGKNTIFGFFIIILKRIRSVDID